ncbi:MAG TPA: hypothetical protein HA262_02885 [Methanosarcina sp.]|jgi:hypothetical protein|nr:hypothetical protein [Methanosarcina sp.]
MADENKIGQDSESKFRYRLGKWLLSRDECVFMNVIEQNRNDEAIRQHLIGSVTNWISRKEELVTQETVSEMCEFIKSENEALYFHLMEKCALKGISVGEGLFEALSMCKCEEAITNPQCEITDDESGV